MNREIRVFVSSTFRDMRAEREILAKHIFPQLRKLCESRGVIWGEVDLRWGITDVQKEKGEVLPICLAEAQKCRPYFIGLLGERYGSVPDAIASDLLERETWLANYRDRSVTELEILHGVLNDPGAARHAFFYLRSPSYAESLPPEQRPAFQEGPTPEELRTIGAQRAAPFVLERKTKLAALKKRILGSGLPVRQNYASPKALGELVLADFTAVIDQMFPEGSQPDPLDREALEHEAFAASRSGVYVGRHAYFGRLDEHARGDGPPLVVVGESGCGKSALLANWGIRYRAEHPEDLLLLHFIGATPDSADWAAMLRRVLGEFSRRFGLRLEIPSEQDALRSAFANALHRAAACGRTVLILDALDQLEDRDGAPDLVWLPPVMPANVRLILSALPGRSLADLKKRAWPTLSVGSLDSGEKRTLVTEYLAQYRKALSPALTERIVAGSQTENPLYLRAMLEEMRLWGEHETLDARADYYLSAGSIGALFERILERYEQDYEGDCPGLVGNVMTALWAARRGLSEAELMDLLGEGNEPLPRAFWSPLYLAAEPSLVNRSGLIGFFHEYFRRAVCDKYLSTGAPRQKAHLKLASYFASHEPGQRRIDELPWQLAEAQAWPSLFDLLSEEQFFDAAWDHNEFDVRSFWARIESNSSLRVLSAYRPELEDPNRFHDRLTHLWNIASLFRLFGHIREAFTLYTYLESRLGLEDAPRLSAIAGTLATLHYDLGELEEAQRLLHKSLALCRETHDSRGLASCLGNQALILIDSGRLDEAMDILKKAEEIYRALADKGALQGCLHFQARILSARGQISAADELYVEAIHICRETGNRDGLQAGIGARAMLLLEAGHPEQALPLLEEKEKICRELGNKDGVSVALGNQALLLKRYGKLDEAMALHRQEEEICRELENQKGLATCLGNQAILLRLMGDPEGALRLHRKEESICGAAGDKHGLARSRGNQALVLLDRRDYAAAMTIIQRQEGLAREIGSPMALIDCLTLKATALLQRGEMGALPPVMQELERLVQLVSSPTGAGTGTRLVPAKATALLQMFEGIRKKALQKETSGHADDERDARYWERRGLEMVMLGDLEEARRHFDRGLALEPDSASLLLNKGTALLKADKRDAALACFDRCLELEPRNALAWNNRGIIMGMTGKYQEALDAFTQALECDPTCAAAEVGRRRALAMLARSRPASVADFQPRPTEDGTSGGPMTMESGPAKCPRCQCELPIESIPKYIRELGIDGIRTQCPDCGTVLVIYFTGDGVRVES